jgi:AcrR family transcriptional regulator
VSAKPKASQRERLIDAMIQTCADVGYQAASIAEVSARAGVSSATFYEQFGGKEECFLAAYRTAAERMFGRVSLVLAQGARRDHGRRVLMELTEALCRDPTGGRVVLIEALAAGPRVREERRNMLRAFGRLTSGFVDTSSANDRTIDIPPIAVMGALRHVVSRHLRTHSEDRLPGLVDAGLTWLGSYAVPARRGHWSTSPAALLASASARAAAPGAPPLEKLPRGRHGLTAGAVARSRRTRLMFATAEVMMRNGYANTTVADIVAEAKVARDVFYEHFADKEEAFLEAQHFPTQYILDRCVAAYFSAPEWPERAWRCLETLLTLINENPAISHLRLVEAYAAGPTAIRRAEEITRSFTIFLEEGYHYRPQAGELPRLCGQAIAGGIFEIIQRLVARGEGDQLRRHLPQLTYLAIAPFTGAEEAIGLVEQMTARHEQGERSEAEVQIEDAARAR